MATIPELRDKTESIDKPFIAMRFDDAEMVHVCCTNCGVRSTSVKEYDEPGLMDLCFWSIGHACVIIDSI